MRNSGISVIRGVATAMIVSCHILQGLDNELAFWLNLGVQIFLCMSGYLYGNKEIRNTVEWYKKQYLKIMKPVWVLLTILVFVIIIGHFNDFSVISLGLSYLGLAGFGTLPELTHTWFITYILFCYLLTPLLGLINIEFTKKTWHFIVALFVLLSVIELLYLAGIISMLPQYLGCYILGFYFAKREFKYGKVELKKLVILISVFAVITLPVRLIVQYGGGDIQLWGWSFIRTQITDWHHTMLGVAIFFMLLLLLSGTNVKYIQLLKLSDKYSYCVYLVHQIFILNTFSLLYITEYIVVNIILIFSGIIISAFMLQWITAKLSIRKKTINERSDLSV